MDTNVAKQIADTLVVLQNSGQTGFWVLLVILLAVIGIGVMAVIMQRISIARFQATSKATEDLLRGVETNIKSVEANIRERELGVKERDEFRAIFAQQFAVVRETNDELRIEMERLKDQQKDLRESINASITAGLEDIRDRLTQTSVKDIISQLPEAFRKDLADEFQASLHASIEKLVAQLNDPVLVQNILRQVDSTVQSTLASLPKNQLTALLPFSTSLLNR